MSNFIFIGWYQDYWENSDKVWGAIRLGGGKAVTVWGKRGKKLQTKIVNDDSSLDSLIRAKIKKGYISVDQAHLTRVYPDFQKDLEKTAFWSAFKVT